MQDIKVPTVQVVVVVQDLKVQTVIIIMQVQVFYLLYQEHLQHMHQEV